MVWIYLWALKTKLTEKREIIHSKQYIQKSPLRSKPIVQSTLGVCMKGRILSRNVTMVMLVRRVLIGLVSALSSTLPNVFYKRKILGKLVHKKIKYFTILTIKCTSWSLDYSKVADLQRYYEKDSSVEHRQTFSTCKSLLWICNEYHRNNFF